MAVKPNISITNNFTAGLKTEFTGLNFPENAATDVDNCVFTLIGDVLRREGIDFEPNFATTQVNRLGDAISTYKWNNVGGDGNTQIVVVQVGATLYFFRSSSATVANPLSTTKLVSTINLADFLIVSAPVPDAIECQYADGNGYLFVYHSSLNSFFCTYNAGTITGTSIDVQIRDFTGIVEPGVSDTTRPLTASDAHQYNLGNQGWGKFWSDTSSTSYTIGTTSPATFTISAGLFISPGDRVILYTPGSVNVSVEGTVTAYSGTALTILITKTAGAGTFSSWVLHPNPALVALWSNAVGTLPSNADVWWVFRNTSNVFDPANTINNVVLDSSPAPKGSFILSAFNQQRKLVSGIVALPDISTTVRPKTGTWFQGRVWYTGVDAALVSGNPYYTWSENIYFSQVVENVTQFGKCYQTNDPTSDKLFDILPTDGGVITIQGCGSIYKLFPIQNGLLVFAANGIWFITGSQGIGFSANDYTITKISSVQNISSTSYVNVQGYPVFWNEEGIHAVSPSKQGGGLTVDNLTLGTIFGFYGGIPLQSKKFTRGDYSHVDYEIQWCYRDTNESSVTDRYQFNKILIYNTVNRAFYVYTITGPPYIHDIRYVVGPGGSGSPEPVFKYLASGSSSGISFLSFADEHDTSYVDWKSSNSIGTNYVSTFTTGYRVHGQGIGQWQPVYIYMYLRNSTNNGYKIQSVWDYAGNRNSNKFSNVQVVNNFSPNFAMLTRRHKLRGHGLAFQLKVSSIDGLPFDVMGWTVYEMINTTP